MTKFAWFILLAVQDPQKTYDLKFTSKPVEGAKSDISDEQSQTVKMKIRQGEQTVLEREDKESTKFVGSEEIVKVKDDKILQAKWTFAQARRTLQGEETAYGFEKKTVIVTRQDDGTRTFAFEDGSPLGAEDLRGIQKAFKGSVKEPGKPSGDEVYAPKKPVKVGESWKPDVELIAKSFMAREAGAIDLAKSSATLTLKSVETRGGAEFGKIEGAFELHMVRLGPIKLDPALPVRFTLDLDACIDGKASDGVLKMKAELKGKSKVSMPDEQAAELEMEMSAGGTMTRRAVK